MTNADHGAEQALEQAGSDDWKIASIKDDWANVF
jgi:hypothetical protein